jgi:hypothetical protein
VTDQDADYGRDRSDLHPSGGIPRDKTVGHLLEAAEAKAEQCQTGDQW